MPMPTEGGEGEEGELDLPMLQTQERVQDGILIRLRRGVRSRQQLWMCSQGEVEVLSQQLGSPSKPPEKKQKMGDGTSKDQPPPLD